MGVQGLPAIASESGRVITVCCLCLHATFKKPVIAGAIKGKQEDEAEEPKGSCYCKLTGPGRTVNPTMNRVCSTFLPAPNRGQRQAALDQLGGAFSFLSRGPAC